MKIESIRKHDSIKDLYFVVIDGVEMRLFTHENPIDSINKLLGVK